MCTLSHLLLVLLFKCNYGCGPHVPLPAYVGLMFIQSFEHWMREQRNRTLPLSYIHDKAFLQKVKERFAKV